MYKLKRDLISRFFNWTIYFIYIIIFFILIRSLFSHIGGSTMITLIKERDQKKYNIKEFILDDENEVSDLPTDVGVRSLAYVISSGNCYMINSEQEWKLI